MVALHYKSILGAAAAIIGLPTAWNLVARNEFERHTLERWMKSKRAGAYLLAFLIFTFSFGRDVTFNIAMKRNAAAALVPNPTAVVQTALKAAGAACIAVGTVLVGSSFARLGVTGTYLGDYFGILMPARVTSFPFSHFSCPMYLGSTLNFTGAALFENNAVGAGLSAVVAATYYVCTVFFENPFTEKIYASKSNNKA